MNYFFKWLGLGQSQKLLSYNQDNDQDNQDVKVKRTWGEMFSDWSQNLRDVTRETYVWTYHRLPSMRRMPECSLEGCYQRSAGWSDFCGSHHCLICPDQRTAKSVYCQKHHHQLRRGRLKN